MTRRLRAALTLTALAVALGSAALLSTPAQSSAGPLADSALAPERRYAFEGDVVETLEAGSYLYLRVRTDSADRWVATLRSGRPKSSRVTVRVIGESALFHSSRLDRDFTDLAFGIVRTR